MTNREKVFMLLEQQKKLEQQIEKAGITTIKPLVQQSAKNQRQINAIMAMEVFANG